MFAELVLPSEISDGIWEGISEVFLFPVQTSEIPTPAGQLRFPKVSSLLNVSKYSTFVKKFAKKTNFYKAVIQRHKIPQNYFINLFYGILCFRDLVAFFKFINDPG